MVKHLILLGGQKLPENEGVSVVIRHQICLNLIDQLPELLVVLVSGISDRGLDAARLFPARDLIEVVALVLAQYLLQDLPLLLDL